MDRREFLTTIAALPLIQLPPWLPTDGVQELVLPNDLAYALERHCLLPLEERIVKADEAAKIAAEMDVKDDAVFRFATDRDKFDYVIFSWLNTGKRNKQFVIAQQIATAGEFSIIKRDGLFVMQTTKCKVPAFRTPERQMVVDYEDEWWWPQLGGGWPSFVQDNELHLHQRDFFILMNEVFDPWLMIDYFEDDILKGEIARMLADRLKQPDIDSNPWPGMTGWKPIADWLDQGECLFVAFPKQPMI